MPKKKKSRKKIKKKINAFLSALIFTLIISFAFSIDWIFGAGFVFSFVFSVMNKVVEKKPFIPIYLFGGALLIRYAIEALLPPVLNSGTYFDIGISAILFLAVFLFGLRIKKGL